MEEDNAFTRFLISCAKYVMGKIFNVLDLCL